MERHAVDEYLERDAPVIERRRQNWGIWTQSSEADPLELCWEALEHLRRVRQALRSNVVNRAHLDEAVELVKRLGWGPEPRREHMISRSSDQNR
jgi:hypothetical protein